MLWMVYRGLLEEVGFEPDLSMTCGEERTLQIGGEVGWETGMHISRETGPGPGVGRGDRAD